MFSRKHNSSWKRNFSIEGLEDRQLMAGDLTAQLVDTTQTAQVSSRFDGKISTAQLTSPTGGQLQTTATVAAVLPTGGVTSEQPTTQPAFVQRVNGDIYIYGSSGDDTVNVTLQASYYYVQVNQQTYKFSGSQVTGGDVYFYGYAGNDYFKNATAYLRTTAYGMEGSDRLIGGAKNDYLDGGNGVDALYGNGGNDILEAGKDDHYSNYLDGGSGIDYLYGSYGKDSLNGGAGDDWLFGGANNDYLFGGDGVDHLYGGDGDDRLNGGGDDDKWDCMYGEAGSDFFENEYIDHQFGPNYASDFYPPYGEILDFESGVDRSNY